MLSAPIPPNEKERLAAVKELKILNTKREERFDRITKKVLEQFGVPISTISILDADREWYKSCQGVDGREGPRATSFCGHIISQNYIFVIEDTLLDSRFADNPQVLGKPFVRFYAGMALRNKKSGLTVGVLCLKDTKPRKFSRQDILALKELAILAEEELNKPLNN
jgi:GAF domain-containing protein